MIRFNIIGRGFLDIEAGNAAGFTRSNPWFRFADVELGRSVEFSVPATTHNRIVLGFGDDPSEYGEQLRTNHTCQLVYDGGQVMGTLAVNAYANGQFSCVFLIGGSSWIDDLQNKKLSECVSDLYILWQHGTTPTNASSADPSLGVELLKYENGLAVADPDWCVAPSVNIRYFINEILTNLGIQHNIAVDQLLYIVAGTMDNGESEVVSFIQLDSTDVEVTSGLALLDVVLTDVEWATAILFGGYVGGGSHTIKAFKVLADLKMSFDTDTVPPDVFLIKKDLSLKNCECLGGYPSDMTGVDEYWRNKFGDLTGKTVEFKKGDIFFFADYFGFVQSTNLWASSQILGNGYFGWKDNAHNFSISARVSVNGELDGHSGQNWFMRYNMPEMTVFEFLKSVCLATGMELTVDPVDGITISDGSYGDDKLGQFKALERVLSIDRVARTAWGENTAAVVVGFDSDDYVTEPIVTEYGIPNEVNTERKEHKSKFSEGNVGDNGIFIADVDPATYKFKAKKWTLAYADPNKAYLQRINAPVAVGYHDIAANSTAVTVKALLPLADFFAMKPSTTWLWRGCSYLWSKASWSDGVLTMEMQRVSAERVEMVPPPPTVTSIEAVFTQPQQPIVGTDSLDDLKQWLTVTATYSDSSTRVLAANEYTLSGTLAYPSATVTVDYQGENDTFTVAVAYDAEVDYIGSTSGRYQWIDTGVIPQSGDVITIEYLDLNGSSSSYNRLFGTSAGSASRNLNIYTRNSKTYSNYGNTSNVTVLISAIDTNWHTIVIDTGSNTATVDGGSSIAVGTFREPTYSMYLFGLDSSGSCINRSYIRVRRFSVGNRLNLVPVRCGTTGYMYDRVSGTLFGNDGTGNFIVGPDV